MYIENKHQKIKTASAISKTLLAVDDEKKIIDSFLIVGGRDLDFLDRNRKVLSREDIVEAKKMLQSFLMNRVNSIEVKLQKEFENITI